MTLYVIHHLFLNFSDVYVANLNARWIQDFYRSPEILQQFKSDGVSKWNVRFTIKADVYSFHSKHDHNC